MCREYLAAKQSHEGVPENRNLPFMKFSVWLQVRVAAFMSLRLEVPLDVILLSELPSKKVVEYSAMHAYGNHYRCESVLYGNRHLSYDLGIAYIAQTTCRASSRDRSPVQADLKFVGVLRNIIQVSYGSITFNVMKCAWIQPNLVGRATMRVDEHRFLLIKRSALKEDSPDPYIMPAHASQVTTLQHRVVYYFYCNIRS